MGNMYRRNAGKGNNGPADLARQFHVPLLGSLPFDEGLVKAVESRDVKLLLKTRFALDLEKAISTSRAL
jgi:hypothetical protein